RQQPRAVGAGVGTEEVEHRHDDRGVRLVPREPRVAAVPERCARVAPPAADAAGPEAARARDLEMALRTAAAWRAWRSFAGASPGTQLFLLGRMAVAPLGPLERDFTQLSGRVLSLGCGYGIVDRYVAEINPAGRIEGIEL